MNNEIDEKIKQVLTAVLDVSEDMIDENTSSGDLEAWDSLKHMNLVMALEEEFDIEFTNEEIAELESFKLISFHVNEKLN